MYLSNAYLILCFNISNFSAEEVRKLRSRVENLESHVGYGQVNSETVAKEHIGKVGQFASYKSSLGDMSEEQLWTFMKTRLNVERSQGEEPPIFHGKK